MGPRWGALGPELEVGAPGFSSRAVASFPAPDGAGRGGAARVPAQRRSGSRAGADRAGWAGDARRSGAPHRPRRLARAPTVSAAAGGGSPAAGEEGRWRRSGLERRSPQTHFPGSAGKGMESPLPAPGPRSPAPGSRSGQAGAAAAAGGRGARSRPEDAVGAGLPRPARSGRRAGCAAFPEARGERWAPRPLRPRLGRRWSGPGVGDLERGLRGPGERAGLEGRLDPAGCVLPGSPGRLVGALCGRRQSRAPTLRDGWGRPEGGRWGEKRRLWGHGRD